MLIIFGDSHGGFNFKNLELENLNLKHDAITMHRIGRDGIIINYDKKYDDVGNTIILAYGEVDCRCHIGRQICKTDYKIVCQTLVSEYFKTIVNNIKYASVIICPVVPPMSQQTYENLHGPITHEFPFIGTNSDRVKYTKYINILLLKLCILHNYKFLNFVRYYQLSDGTLNFDKSDKTVHIRENSYILKLLDKTLKRKFKFWDFRL